LILSIIFFLMLIITPVLAFDEVRVGVYQNEPFVFVENGEVKGFYIDILEEVAKKRGGGLSNTR